MENLDLFLLEGLKDSLEKDAAVSAEEKKKIEKRNRGIALAKRNARKKRQEAVNVKTDKRVAKEKVDAVVDQAKQNISNAEKKKGFKTKPLAPKKPSFGQKALKSLKNINTKSLPVEAAILGSGMLGAGYIGYDVNRRLSKEAAVNLKVLKDLAGKASKAVTKAGKDVKKGYQSAGKRGRPGKSKARQSGRFVGENKKAIGVGAAGTAAVGGGVAVLKD